MGKGRCYNWSNVSKVVCEVFHAETFSFNKAPQLGRSVEVDSNQIDINWEQATLYHAGDGQQTQNSQVKHWKSSAPA